MFWTDWGEEARIERAGMDGSADSRASIVTTDIFWPNGLTIDYEGGRIYWTDAKLKYIHSALLDGTDRRPVVDPDALHHPFSITIHASTIYWTDWQKRAIFSADKRDGGNQTMIADKLYSPMGIHVFSASRQPIGEYFILTNQ